MQERTITGSRGKSALLLIASLMFVVGGLALVLTSNIVNVLLGGCCIVFFGLGVPVAIAQLVRPNRLHLSDEGLVWRIALRNQLFHLAWNDVEAFFVCTVRSAKFAGFRYRPGRRPQTFMASINRKIAGADGAIGGGWTLSTEELVTLLNTYRSTSIEKSPG